ncbi:MAG: hypothetical protein QXU98_11930 [Candidatus Parvarchaeota archaeon]
MSSIEEPYMDNPWVYIDNFDAIKKILDHLTSKGHKRIGFLGFRSERSRFMAFKKIIAKKRLNYDADIVKLGEELAEDMPKSAKTYIVRCHR